MRFFWLSVVMLLFAVGNAACAVADIGAPSGASEAVAHQLHDSTGSASHAHMHGEPDEGGDDQVCGECNVQAIATSVSTLAECEVKSAPVSVQVFSLTEPQQSLFQSTYSVHADLRRWRDPPRSTPVELGTRSLT